MGDGNYYRGNRAMPKNALKGRFRLGSYVITCYLYRTVLFSFLALLHMKSK
jgi:hypothetical protein